MSLQSEARKNIASAQDVPAFRGLWSTMGAGLVWASMAMGSGELIWWPYLTAKYGSIFIGLLLPACAMQYFVNQEISRYTATTGEGLFQGFARVHHMFAIVMWIMMVISFLWVGSYVTSGATALYALTNFPHDWSQKSGSLFWSYLIIATFSFVLLFAKNSRRVIEVFMKIMIIVCLLGVVVTLINPIILRTAADFLSAYFNVTTFFKAGFPEKWDSSDGSILIAAICFAGMGGFLNVMYSYWIRDKGVCMSILNGNDGESAAHHEFYGKALPFLDTPQNKLNYGKWIRFLRIDNLMAIGINTLMATIMCWFAWAILTPRGEFPHGWEIAVVQSRFFEYSMGPVGRVIFLLIAVSFLCDSWLGIVDACARMYSDFFQSVFQFSRKYKAENFYRIFVVIQIVISCFTIPLAEPGPLLIIGGVLNFIAMPIYCSSLVYINYFKIPTLYPKWTRPSFATLVCFSVVTALYIAIACWYIKTILHH